MKKYLISILSLCLIILAVLLCGCDVSDGPVDIKKDDVENTEGKKPNSTSNATDKPSGTEKGDDKATGDATEDATKDATEDATSGGEANDVTDEKQTEAADEAPKYWEIQCYPTKSYTARHFSVEGSKNDITLSVSSEWSFERGEDGYDILRDGNKIGEIIEGEPKDAAEWKKESGFTRQLSGRLSVGKAVESKGEGKDTEYRYKFQYVFGDGDDFKTLTVTVKYDEVDANAADVLYNSIEFYDCSNIPDGALSSLQQGNILILGNSFINSSSIGYILEEIIAVNNKELNVVAISRGYATVQTYVEDAGMMDSIASGMYDAVFICGFYSNPEVEHLKTLRSVCESSDTELIIFPAHNEQRGVIDKAQKGNLDLLTLDWKAEVDALIESGIERSHFCVNDMHQHSTELAGIVGAQMIYKAIFGEMPSYDGASCVYNYNAKEILGQYLVDGNIALDYEVIYV